MTLALAGAGCCQSSCRPSSLLTQLAGHCSSLENEGGLGQVCVFLPNAPSKEQGGFQTGLDNFAKDFLFSPENVILMCSHFHMEGKL